MCGKQLLLPILSFYESVIQVIKTEELTFGFGAFVKLLSGCRVEELRSTFH